MNREMIEQAKREYPAWSRIVLDDMPSDPDPIPVGTQGTVIAVDDAGGVITAWDNGRSLSALNGIDRFHKPETDDEMITTLNHYGSNQPAENARCPRCGNMMFGPTAHNALSRYADIMVCSRCGMAESMEKAGLMKSRPLSEWAAIVIPRIGGGAWKR